MVEMPFTNSDDIVEDHIKAFGVKGQVGANGVAWGRVVDADCSRVAGMVGIESDAL